MCIRDSDYDCILLDIMLPDGSGLQLLEELKRQRRQAGIIIIWSVSLFLNPVLSMSAQRWICLLYTSRCV